MGNNNVVTKRPTSEDGNNQGDGHDIIVESPMEEGFVFPGHGELLDADLHGSNEERKKEKKVPAVIRWKGGGKEVFISGSYDNWKNKLRLNKSHDDFVAIVDLPPGEHQYKFLIDGEWKIDQTEPTKENDVGSLNNVLDVKLSDFEVFEALAYDLAPNTQASHQVKDFSSTADEEYTQEMPKALFEDPSLFPPALPPHLLNKVLLNQDIDLSFEPSLLPEPQHVMLNHMYALSIKEGVMALSATHRYKKKFVTTLLYKPI